jgi:hypothetical protein
MLSILKQIIKNLSEEHSNFFGDIGVEKKKSGRGATASTANSASTIGFVPLGQH